MSSPLSHKTAEFLPKQSPRKTQYDWIGGKPAQTDNVNFEWSLGRPFVIYEKVVVAGGARSFGYIIG